MQQITTPFQSQPVIRPVQSRLTFADHLDHLLARVGVKRLQHRVMPGLYALGNPAADAPVFVTANYTLSFDALRSALDGIDGYILVLDTRGINVWCAAGEGTFGTDELVRRIEASQLKAVVSQRQLILPQLGAPGIAAHEVRKRSGFKVEYGPVRASDLPEYLKTHRATPEMRLVRFALTDRLTVAVVDVMRALLPLLVVAVAMYFLGGAWAGAAAVVTVLSGLLVFPALLPWLPGRDFTSKGLFLGLLAALPFALAMLLSQPEAVWWLRTGKALGYLLAMPPLVAYLALLFTGSTTFSSRSGVKNEIFTYIPRLAWMLGAGVVLWIGLFVIGRLGRF
jgi:CO dehydrogenase/acetyl-CoA synthase delta subunit